MVGETGSEASSQTPSKVVAQVDRQRMAQAMRLAREKAKRARAKASDTAIASTPVQIAKRDLGENRDPVPVCSSEAIAKHSTDDRTAAHSPEPIAQQPTAIETTDTRETSSPVDPPSWFVEPRAGASAAQTAGAQAARMELERLAPEPTVSVPWQPKKRDDDAGGAGNDVSVKKNALPGQPAETPKRAANESRSPAPLPSLEPIAKAPAEIQKTVAPESTSAVQSPAPRVQTARPRVITYYRASDYMPVLDFETRVLESAARVPVQPLGQRFATWWGAIGSALRGPWRDAVWDFYERMTDVSWWWCAVIKPVLKFLGRFIPGREPEPSRVSKAIREGFRFLHEPPRPWPPQWQSKKPKDIDPPKET